MCARMGAVTGKGLSDLIREEFGLRITFLMMLGILITQFRQRGHGIYRHRHQSRIIRPFALRDRPGLRRHRLADRGERPIQDA